MARTAHSRVVDKLQQASPWRTKAEVLIRERRRIDDGKRRSNKGTKHVDIYQ